MCHTERCSPAGWAQTLDLTHHLSEKQVSSITIVLPGGGTKIAANENISFTNDETQITLSDNRSGVPWARCAPTCDSHDHDRPGTCSVSSLLAAWCPAENDCHEGRDRHPCRKPNTLGRRPQR